MSAMSLPNLCMENLPSKFIEVLRLKHLQKILGEPQRQVMLSGDYGSNSTEKLNDNFPPEKRQSSCDPDLLKNSEPNSDHSSLSNNPETKNTVNEQEHFPISVEKFMMILRALPTELRFEIFCIVLKANLLGSMNVLRNPIDAKLFGMLVSEYHLRIHSDNCSIHIGKEMDVDQQKTYFIKICLSHKSIYNFLKSNNCRPRCIVSDLDAPMELPWLKRVELYEEIHLLTSDSLIHLPQKCLSKITVLTFPPKDKSIRKRCFRRWQKWSKSNLKTCNFYLDDSSIVYLKDITACESLELLNLEVTKEFINLSTKNELNYISKIIQKAHFKTKITLNLLSYNVPSTSMTFNILEMVNSLNQDTSVRKYLHGFLEKFGAYITKAMIHNTNLGDTFYRIFPYLKKVEILSLFSPYSNDLDNFSDSEQDIEGVDTDDEEMSQGIINGAEDIGAADESIDHITDHLSGQLESDQVQVHGTDQVDTTRYEIDAPSATTVVLDYTSMIDFCCPMYLTKLKNLKFLMVKSCRKVDEAFMNSIANTVKVLYFESVRFRKGNLKWPTQLRKLTIKNHRTRGGLDRWQPDFSQLTELRQLNLLEFQSLELVSDYLASIPTTSLEVLFIAVIDIYVFEEPYESTGTSETHSFDLLNLSRFTNVSELSLRFSHFKETNIVKFNLLPPSLVSLKYTFIYEPGVSYDGISFIKFQFLEKADTSCFPISITGIDCLSLEDCDLTKVRYIQMMLASFPDPHVVLKLNEIPDNLELFNVVLRSHKVPKLKVLVNHFTDHMVSCGLAESPNCHIEEI
ncbi:unnamed protein product [Ambrosiozyma monospora]|uniref:Unnamed protein product n=1 Tax=Ambrosiozyma monospora TaxID=43982 RepID=A0A9W7DER5_AMBMO|nr:unnamed protein product [Ambrosiozyma monospora]